MAQFCPTAAFCAYTIPAQSNITSMCSPLCETQALSHMHKRWSSAIRCTFNPDTVVVYVFCNAVRRDLNTQNGKCSAW